MDRRNFLQGVALMFAAKTAQRVFPFRVYSIPKNIAIAPAGCDLRMNGVTIASGLEPNTNYFITAHGLRAGDVIDIMAPDFSVKRGSALVIATGLGGKAFLNNALPNLSPGDIVAMKRQANDRIYCAPLPLAGVVDALTQNPDSVQLSDQNPSAR